MADAATYLAACLVLSFALYRIVLDRGTPEDPAVRYICFFALAMGGALLLLAPRSMAILHRLVPLPHLGLLLGAELKVCSLTFLAMLAHSLDDAGADKPSAGRIAGLAAAVGGTLAVLFLAAHAQDGTTAVRAQGADRWLIAAYDFLLIGYFVRCLGMLITLLGRNARRVPPSLFRTGLRLMMASAAVGVVWTLLILGDVASVLRDGTQPGTEDRPSAVLAVAVAALAVGGATATIWGRTVSAPARIARAYRSYCALEPLWSALHEAVPGIALAPPSPHDRWRSMRNAEFALYRRVIEIHDGRLCLRHYSPAAVSGPDADGSPSGARQQRDAAAEAVAISAGLAAMRTGKGSAAAPPHLSAPASSSLGTLDADVDWLLAVTAAFVERTERAANAPG
jgi:hypothetical protein